MCCFIWMTLISNLSFILFFTFYNPSPTSPQIKNICFLTFPVPPFFGLILMFTAHDQLFRIANCDFDGMGNGWGIAR